MLLRSTLDKNNFWKYYSKKDFGVSEGLYFRKSSGGDKKIPILKKGELFGLT